jgi:vacuolar-type H+-ATPase subunit H
MIPCFHDICFEQIQIFLIMRGHYDVAPESILDRRLAEMERKEILEKLKTTEAEIRINLEAAQHKRNEILASAQQQARKLEDDGERRIKTEREKMLNTAKKEIEAKRQHALKKAAAEAEEQKKNAQIKKAKDFFVKKFEEHVHV